MFFVLDRKTLIRIGVIALAAILLVLAIIFSTRAATQAANANRVLPIYGVDTGDEKRIAISFDAAWGDEKTAEILDILDQYNIKSTFFLVGFWVDKYPEKVQLIAERGHEIGNHSTTHPKMSQLSREQIYQEIQITSQKIKDLTGQTPTDFRPPYGDYNNQLVETVRGMGMEAIQWSVDSLDWKSLGIQPMIDQVLNNVKPGSIVLFHNNSDYILDALPTILQQLIAQGYTIVPVRELVLPQPYAIKPDGTQYAIQAAPSASAPAITPQPSASIAPN